ncbi:MAG: DUF2235 domain-containing protein [Amaricoccus sp.]
MTRLIVCCDGTWNTPDQREMGLPAPTNVVKFANALVRSDEQQVYYHPGVGTDGSRLDRLKGGGLGRGLDDNVKSAYHWLACTWRKGDSIWLLGFSRGAYTARSVGGMISRCGLLDLDPEGSTTDAAGWKAVDEAFDTYRAKGEMTATADMPFHNVAVGSSTLHSMPVGFIGVWDTVGALGVPADLALLRLIDDPRRHSFHDTELSPVVAHARHAVAMDEQRASFGPTLWTNVDPKRDVKQLWFPGVHGDVGGGYARSDLSDGALGWMMDEAGRLGLEFRKGIRERLKPDALGVLHDSLTGLFRRLWTRPRAVPRVGAEAPLLHESARKRFSGASFDHADYWASAALGDGRAVERDIYARLPWNPTGLYLEAGTEYRFDATGEWLDGSISCGPGGTRDGKFQIGELIQMAGALIDTSEEIWRTLSNDQKAQFWYSRRADDQDWFALIGVVANAEEGDYETFLIGEGTTWAPTRSGYLYAYANDAWAAYGNNRGSVRLTVAAVPPDAPAGAEVLAAAEH